MLPLFLVACITVIADVPFEVGKTFAVIGLLGGQSKIQVSQIKGYGSGTPSQTKPVKER